MGKGHIAGDGDDTSRPGADQAVVDHKPWVWACMALHSTGRVRVVEAVRTPETELEMARRCWYWP
jgi:hypothetical protein